MNESFSGWQFLFTEARAPLVLTLQIGACVAFFSGLIAALFGVLLHRTDLPFARKLDSWITLPYALPGYLLGMAWVTLANPRVGILKALFPETGIYSVGGIIFVETTVAFVFPYLALTSGFQRLDPTLEEAARTSGASPWKVFRDIQLPLLFPSWAQGVGLAFLYACSSFGVPALLGIPARQFVLTTLIYSELRLGGAEGLTRGLALAGLLLSSVLVTHALFSTLLLRKKRSFALTSGKASRPTRLRLGYWRYAGTFVLLSWVLITTGLPWLALGISALASHSGNLHPAHWTLTHFEHLLGLSDFKEAVLNSTTIALSVGLAIASLSFALGYLAYFDSRFRRVSGLFRIPFALPGTVLALGWILLSSFWRRFFPDSSFSPDLPWIAISATCFLKYAVTGVESTGQSFQQIHPCLNEAGRVSGASRWELLRHLWWPLLRKQWGAVFLLAALPVFTELTMSLLLTGPGGMTLGTLLFQLQDYSDPAAAAALAWILLTLAALVPLVVRWLAAGIQKEVSS